MSKKLDLMVDIDDVLIPTMDSIHRLAFEAGLHDNDVLPSWRGWEAYGCDEQVYWDLWSQFALAGGYVTTPPYDGAIEALRFLAWEGHRIHLVTARGFMNHASDIREWTKIWVSDFAVPHETLTFAQDKAAAQADLGVQFASALDDSPSNFRKLQEAGVSAYLMHHHHNADFPAPPSRRVPTVWDWAYRVEQEAGDDA